MSKSRAIRFCLGLIIQCSRDKLFWLAVSAMGFPCHLHDRQSTRAQSFSPWQPALSRSFRALFTFFQKAIHLDKRLQNCDFTEELSDIISLFLRGTHSEIFHRCSRRYRHVRLLPNWHLPLFSV